VFGISFSEFLVLGTVALLVLGPEKLPGVLRTLGKWLAKLRKVTTEMRTQSGIDDVLRSEGLDGGLSELRSLIRGGIGSSVFAHHAPPLSAPNRASAVDHFVPDKSREYPAEGVDAYGALPEDLVPGYERTNITGNASVPLITAAAAGEPAPEAATGTSSAGAAVEAHVGSMPVPEAVPSAATSPAEGSQ
jgi:sec-independent protein translocase protein TatB